MTSKHEFAVKQEGSFFTDLIGSKTNETPYTSNYSQQVSRFLSSPRVVRTIPSRAIVP